jgi:hypothetical protein
MCKRYRSFTINVSARISTQSISPDSTGASSTSNAGKGKGAVLFAGSVLLALLALLALATVVPFIDLLLNSQCITFFTNSAAHNRCNTQGHPPQIQYPGHPATTSKLQVSDPYVGIGHQRKHSINHGVGYLGNKKTHRD